jgi:hypothetical protein
MGSEFKPRAATADIPAKPLPQPCRAPLRRLAPPHPMSRRSPLSRPACLLLCLVALGLSGCDQLGIETPAVVAAKRDAEGRAIGGACRHAARSIEQCYAINRRADKAAIFAGWREMNDYMRENGLEPMPASAEDDEADGEGAIARRTEARGS